MTPVALDGAVRAHLLLQADPGATEALRDYLEDVPGVVDATSTTGAFDAVARVAVPDERALQKVLVAARYAPGWPGCACAGRP